MKFHRSSGEQTVRGFDERSAGGYVDDRRFATGTHSRRHDAVVFRAVVTRRPTPVVG